MHELQAAAAVGQMGLAQIYEIGAARARHRQRAGAAHPRRPGRPRALSQRALDPADAARPRRVPVINENDTVVNDEIKFGDNDTLGALVANLVEADAAGDPDRPARACSPPIRARTRRARCIDERARRRSRRSSAWPAAPASRIGRGGMLTKVLAAKRAARSGAQHGDRLGPRARRAAAPRRRRGASAPRWSRRRRSWPRASSGWPTTCSCAARCVVDDGAAAKLRDGGKSLLPIGVVGVAGRVPARRRDRRARRASGERDRAAA